MHDKRLVEREGFNFSRDMFQVPHVNRSDYQLIDISEDGFVRHLSFTAEH